MSALAAGVNKKRKKSEPKPQAQINKCNNEKRRREQENNYIEELAELISANIADMSTSVKPDKCAILQEAVNQIRSIKQETTTQSSDPVQQGEVSSSRPTILSNELYGPLLLEALEGFLFVVNSEGKVEHVTENVSTYIKFTKDDILGKSIYNFIHHGDHTKFHTNLPMTIEWGSDQQVTNRSKSIDIRLLVKPPDDIDETVEEKQQRNFRYELMHISSTQLRDQISVSEEDGSDSGPYLLCVASRISHRDKTICSIEQFTTKLDTTGKIICVDTSSVSDLTAQFIKKELKNRVLKELVPQQDVHKVSAHLRETLSSGLSTSAIYRLQIGQERYVQVQTKSKLFKTHATNDSDFIMATHSILDSENDSVRPTDPGGGSMSTTTSTNNNNTTSSSSSVGGPLMTSVVNGTARNGPQLPPNNETTSTSSTPNSLFNPNSNFNAFTLDNDYFDVFPTSSTWELDPPNNWQETARPDSRHSVTTPTSRPPSNPSYSNAPTVVQSSPFQTQPSPSVPNPATPVAYGGANFPFSPLEEQNYPMEEQKDTKANVLEEAAMMESSNKLRILLTEPPSDNRDRILKELLNRKDDDTGKNDNRQSPRGLMGRPSMPGPSEPPKSTNNMLLQLLNDKSSDDDDLESRTGVRNKSELLQQLLKPEKDIDDDRKSDSQAHREDSLLRSLGFPPSPSTDRPRKRPSEDRDDGPSSKREASQVSSSGNSLRERNKMLASLLAKQPVNNQPIPPVPAHEITATPQEKLPRITDPNKNIQLAMAAQSNNINNSMNNTMNAMMNNAMGNTRMSLNRMPGRPAQTTNYLNAVLTASTLQQRNDVRQQLNQLNSNCYPATSSTNTNTTIENNNIGGWDNNNLANQMQLSNDPLLSDILDQVIDIVPDDIMHLLEPTGADLQTQGNNFQARLTETMAIEVIQKSLMQYESVVKSTSSLSMPGTPPAYSTATLSNQLGVFSHPSQAAAKLQQRSQQMRLGSVTQQYTAGALNQQQLLLQQKKLQQQKQQQEQKRRLLMQQKQQQLLIPSNAAVNEINSMQNIDSLLNNTVAPNVTLKRSSSVPEPQLSPGYSGQLTTQAQRVGTSQQQPYSPHSQMASPLGQQSFTQTTTVGSFPNPGQRLSPQSQFNAQLSPRQAYPQVSTQNTNWQQQAQVRLTMQQNPMLTAQLTRPSPQTSGQPQTQQQRTLNSPGSVVQTRHSPYPADQFPPPTSPTSAFNNQYLRLQRANSAPTATTQLPGGLGSPRPYGREHHHSHPPPSPYHPSLPPPPPHPQQQQPPPNLPPPHQAQSQPMMYQQHQQDSQYCPSYDPMGYPGVDRGRPVPPPHLQPGVSASGPTSEFVRQELRAVVGARTAQAQPPTPQPAQANSRGQTSQMIGVAVQQQQQSTVTDLESLGITFEMPTGASDSPKLWGAMGSDMGSISPQPPSSRTSMEETRQGDQKSSLLQKLLSE